jgi:hypothetical protein
MVYDRNPKYGDDQSFSEGARRIADLLWENSDGDLSAFPSSYLENLRHEFADGRVSMMELIDRVDLGPEATYDDYVEVVDMLMAMDPDRFANPPEEIVEIQPSQLLYEFEPDFDFSEFDFAEEVEEEVAVAEQPEQDPFSDKMELFLKKVIASVYRDGVTSVTDIQGNPPNAANNYLLSDDGKSFSGIFYDSPPGEQTKKFPFQVIEKGPDQWQIKY